MTGWLSPWGPKGVPESVRARRDASPLREPRSWLPLLCCLLGLPDNESMAWASYTSLWRRRSSLANLRGSFMPFTRASRRSLLTLHCIPTSPTVASFLHFLPYVSFLTPYPFVTLPLLSSPLVHQLLATHTLACTVVHANQLQRFMQFKKKKPRIMWQKTGDETVKRKFW